MNNQIGNEAMKCTDESKFFFPSSSASLNKQVIVRLIKCKCIKFHMHFHCQCLACQRLFFFCDQRNYFYFIENKTKFLLNFAIKH